MPIFILLIAIVSAFVGAGMASSHNKNPFAWAIVCFLFPLIGILLLAFSASGPDTIESVTPTKSYDHRKWQTLIEVDKDIASAAQKARSASPDAEDVLASKYLVLNDKAYLPALLSKVLEDVREDRLQDADGNRVISIDPDAPSQGQLGGCKFIRKPDGVYIVTSGKSIGRKFDSYPSLVSHLESDSTGQRV